MVFRILDYFLRFPGKMRHPHFKMQPKTTFGHSVSLLMLMFLLSSSFFLCQVVEAASIDNKDLSSSSSSISDLIPSEPIKIKLLAPSMVSKKHTRTRQNSRFLRNFPPVELLNLARQTAMANDNNEIEPFVDYNYDNYNHRNSIHNQRNNYGGNNYGGGNYGGGNYGGNTMSMSSSFGNHQNWPTKSHRIDAENSPIFYIKLPPVPYVFMPGIGYVSPHPYSNAPSSMPMGMNTGQGMMPQGFGSFSTSGQESSVEQNQSSDIFSLPLKFLSNGRPHQIESPKRKRRPGIKDNSSENKGASLISGGKYSFNGRPTSVFVFRSPVGSSNRE